MGSGALVARPRETTTTITRPANPPGAPSEDTLVVTRDLVKRYVTGDVETTALAGVDLEIRRGEMVAIMGPSGCGKTTLLNCLSGLEAPSGGRVWVDGEDLWALGDDARTRFRARAMGFVFQAYNLLPVLSAEENVELPLLVSGVRPKEARRRAHDALRMVGLTDREHHRPQQLSGGQQQRVAIARSLVHDPPLVWADEPTGNLDSETSADVMGLVTELNERTGKTFVIVTHDAAIAAGCHRVVTMSSGRIESGAEASPKGARWVARGDKSRTTTRAAKRTTDPRASKGRPTPAGGKGR